jgi:hypothetical protein
MDISDRPLSEEEEKEEAEILKKIEELKPGQYYYSGYNSRLKKWEEGVKSRSGRWVWKKPD